MNSIKANWISKLIKLGYHKPGVISFSIDHKNRHYSQSTKGENVSKRTCLYDFHISKGGKIVDFAGFQMPVQYKDLSINDSHLHTRQSSSLFDVSHMLQMMVRGKDCIEFFENLSVADIQSLPENSGTLSLYTNERGGIIDDLIVTKTSNDCLYVVSNAGRIAEDTAHVSAQCQAFKSKGKDVSIEILSRGLLALQGPLSAKCLQELVSIDLSKLYFMSSVVTPVFGVNDCRITRCGYTGEDGFEISVPTEKAQLLAETILSSSKGAVRLAGLGARDTLRLEAGLCLYGNDIDENTTPIEAGLTWTIAKRRRTTADFIGAHIVLKQLKDKPSKRRVGLLGMTSGPPARSHTTVLDVKDNKEIGHVTSGCPSPSLKKNIAMAYLPFSYKIGSKVICNIRGKHLEYEIVKMPFLSSNYYIKQ